MDLPSIEATDANLRICLLLKADDLYFTLSAPHNETLRNDFLGIPVQGLADENLSDEDIASIDLNRFAIAHSVRRLHAMLEGRYLSLEGNNQPDPEFGRSFALDFLEHFLSTLPEVALGGFDLTAARNGETRKIYDLAYAWLNLIETIQRAFIGEIESSLTVKDLALLSGLETRTLRNRCGPGKLIRTSPTRASQMRNSASPAFVYLHTLDAVDWLRTRKDFKISQIDPAWIDRQLNEATPSNAARGLLVASIINVGSLAALAPTIGFSPQEARDWFDRGEPLRRDIFEKLIKRLGNNSQVFAA